MKLSDILLLAAIGFAIVAIIGAWQHKRHPEKANAPDRTVENVADLNDHFNRARYQGQDNK